jgi:hypothetical protein
MAPHFARSLETLIDAIPEGRQRVAASRDRMAAMRARLAKSNRELSRHLSHAASAKLGAGRTQRLAAFAARLAIDRQAVVPDGIRVRFVPPRDSLVLGEKAAENLFLHLGSRLEARPHLLELDLVEHWHFCFAAPAPQHFHCLRLHFDTASPP